MVFRERGVADLPAGQPHHLVGKPYLLGRLPTHLHLLVIQVNTFHLAYTYLSFR